MLTYTCIACLGMVWWVLTLTLAIRMMTKFYECMVTKHRSMKQCSSYSDMCRLRVCRALSNAGFRCVGSNLLLIEKVCVLNPSQSNKLQEKSLKLIGRILYKLIHESHIERDEDYRVYDPDSIDELDQQRGPPKTVLTVCISQYTIRITEVFNVEYFGQLLERPHVVMCYM